MTVGCKQSWVAESAHDELLKCGVKLNSSKINVGCSAVTAEQLLLCYYCNISLGEIRAFLLRSNATKTSRAQCSYPF